MRILLKRKESIVCLIICTLFFLNYTNEKVVYADNVTEADTSIILKENSTIFSAMTMLKIAEEKLEEGRSSQNVILLQGQSFNIRKNDMEYCVISSDKKLIIEKNGIVKGEETGTYKITVFYKDVGFTDYIVQIRSPEVVENHDITLCGDIAYSLNLKNSDLATYRSSDESVVTVSEDGVMQAKRVGKAVITATINGYQTVELYASVVKTFSHYTEEELNLIYAIVQQECATSYEGALAVISCAYNRSLSNKHVWKGADPLSQLTAEGQFCYSIDNHWKKYLNGGIHDYVKQAVYDCLYLGKTNHDFLSYRGFKIEGAVNFDGNFYFDSL